MSSQPGSGRPRKGLPQTLTRQQALLVRELVRAGGWVSNYELQDAVGMSLECRNPRANVSALVRRIRWKFGEDVILSRNGGPWGGGYRLGRAESTPAGGES